MKRGAVALLAALLALTAVKLWWCGRFELSPDEAYYWLWSKRLDWAYFSKGPGIALAIRFATWVLGDTERGVRWLSPLLGLATSGVLYLLVRDAFSRVTALITVAVLQCVPIFTVGTLLMTIDPLAVFFWTLALLCGWRGLQRQAPAWWAAAGAACGMGFACKYTNVLVLCGLLLAAGRARGRWWSVAAFAPFAVPPLLWNAAHGWPTVAHLFERGGLAREGAWLQPRETLEFLAVHLGTWSPVLFVLMLIGLRGALRAEASRFLLLCSAPVLVMYCVLALHEAGEANWTAPGVLGLLPIAIDHWRTRLRPWGMIAAVVPAMLLSVAIANTNLVRAAGIALPAKSDPSTRLRGWKETAEALSGLPGPIVTHHYGLAAELSFYGVRNAWPVSHRRPGSQFDIWDDGPFCLTVASFASERDSLPEGWPRASDPVVLDIKGPGGTLRTIRLWLPPPMPR